MIAPRLFVSVLLMLTLVHPLQVVAAEKVNETSAEATDSSETTTTPEQETEPGGLKGWLKTRKVRHEADPNRGRLLPIPVVITEPAIGEGLGLALTYFHRKKDEPGTTTLASLESLGGVSREQQAPPTLTAAFGAYTSNDTAAGGIAHVNSFKDDHIRFTGMMGYANVNSTFYIVDQPFKFNIEGFLAYQETRFRFGDSRWFWGLGFSYLNADAAFRVELPDNAPIDLFPYQLANAGLAGKLAWDSRDNTSMPNRGQFLDLAVWRFDNAIGGDYNYWDSRLKLLSFHPLHDKFVLGARLEYSTVNGNPPFFAFPYVKLRGIPALRYQGDRAVVAEIEGRYHFSPGWALLGFAGTGRVRSDIPIIDTEQKIYSYGLGLRYRIFEAQNVWVGVDVAQGPESTNWYIQVGQTW